MRNLKTADLFALSRILKKMNLKEELKELFTDVTGKSEEEKQIAAKQKEIEVMYLFIERIGDAEKEVYKFFASLTDKSVKDIEELKIQEFINLVEELFKQEGIGSFFTTALK